MTHEFKKIIRAYLEAQKKNYKAVLASVVYLEGSSYRRPGVRMLILEDGSMIGAVSGGCVEKEVKRQAESVFKTHKAKMMTYDGRYRLGCEGILYILLEPFGPDKGFFELFTGVITQRKKFTISSYYQKQEGESEGLGSMMEFDGSAMAFQPNYSLKTRLSVFKEEMKPCFKLVIIGAEHDAVQLCTLGAFMGWEVTIVATPLEEKTISDFQGAEEFKNSLPEDLEVNSIDRQTAIVVMTHSYAKDLKYLLALKETEPNYLGLLGPARRREKLLGELIELAPDIPIDFFDSIHGPAGLNIGAETPQEIAIAIFSEILSVIRDQPPMMLKNKIGGIHS